VADLAATGARVVVLTPAHQFPTGAVLGPERRRALLSWAATADGLIVEDDYDAEYRYDRSPVPALQASAPNLVLYAGSTSKTLAPGMRLGWLIPPHRMRDDLITAKHAADLGSPALPQLVLAQLIASGALEQHIRVVRKRQRSRRDALLTALHTYLPEAQIEGIGAGLHLLATFPSLGDASDTDLAERVLQAGVLVHPLSWHCQRDAAPGFVLGYAVHTPDQMHEAVQRIAGAIGPGQSGRGNRAGVSEPGADYGALPACLASLAACLASLVACLVACTSARRCLRAAERSWRMRAVPASTTSRMPQTAESSSATPSGRWLWIPK
jgi:GntR family transcriptional regulator/MocR family aminotransferase